MPKQMPITVMVTVMVTGTLMVTDHTIMERGVLMLNLMVTTAMGKRLDTIQYLIVAVFTYICIDMFLLVFASSPALKI